MLVHLDDYTSDDPRLEEKLLMLLDSGVKLKLHALMSGSSSEQLQLLPVSVALHGWDHFCEPSFGYWKGRHLLELAQAWKCFDQTFKMPWNRMPRPGFLRALRENGWGLVTPYRWQALIATAVGCRVELAKPDFLLHPPDLLLGSNNIKRLLEQRRNNGLV